VLVVHQKMCRAKVLELESELELKSNSTGGGGGWESADDVPAAPGIGRSTLVVLHWGGSVPWN
jgi:hypothetical protein